MVVLSSWTRTTRPLLRQYCRRRRARIVTSFYNPGGSKGKCFVVRAAFRWSSSQGARSTAATNNNDDDERNAATAFAAASARDDELLFLRSLPKRYLRSADPSNYDPVTFQRNDVSYHLGDGKMINRLDTNDDDRVVLEVEEYSQNERGHCTVTWNDGHASDYSRDWVKEQRELWECGGRRPGTNDSDADDLVLWSGMTEESLRSSEDDLHIDFESAVHTAGMQRAVRALYRYGILLVTQTPIRDEGAGIAALASALGGGALKHDDSCILHHYRRRCQRQEKQTGNNDEDPVIMLPRGTDGPLRTLYGTVWSTTSSGQAAGASVADSAYGQDGLPLHTDMTYHRDPPGLQIFTMVQPAQRGGESIFGDGYRAAERLRYENRDAFDTLRRAVRRYRSVDPATGWHLQASGPVISTAGERVVAIRHNDLDRLPDVPPLDMLMRDDPSSEIESFYSELERAHQAWDEILSRDDTRLVVNLQPGETVVVANQRCFHGRYSFSTTADLPRTVMGCYVSQDELNSRFRWEGYSPY